VRHVGNIAFTSRAYDLYLYKQWFGWWRGVVGNAFQMKRSYSTPGLVST